jgi:hypothetical protein
MTEELVAVADTEVTPPSVFIARGVRRFVNETDFDPIASQHLEVREPDRFYVIPKVSIHGLNLTQDSALSSRHPSTNRDYQALRQ